GPVVPRDVVRAPGVPDEQVFHLASAVDEDRLRVLREEVEGLAGLEVLHADGSGRYNHAAGWRRPGSGRGDARICVFAASNASPSIMQPDRTADLVRLMRRRILVLDGAMGTQIQACRLGEADFRGEFHDHPGDLKGDNDLLVLTRPDVVRGI